MLMKVHNLELHQGYTYEDFTKTFTESDKITFLFR